MKNTLRRLALLVMDASPLAAVVITVLAAVSALVPAAAATATAANPTIVLVHGAFADSSSWNQTTARLSARGYHVVTVANPLRSLHGDAAYLASVIDAIDGSIVLVGHSYGGSVISNAAADKSKVRALVYVAAFAPDEGESAGSLANRFAGGTLATALAPPVALGNGDKDLYIQPERFQAQFAADVSAARAGLMAVAQRPITASAIDEPAGKPAWKSIPSWFVYGTEDRNIPAAAQAFMAQRASSRKTVVIRGASHVVMVSHPDAVAMLIEEAAASAAMR